VGRVLSTAFCVALLAVAAAAFALTEGAKTSLSPIYGTRIDKVFSPTCNLHFCARRVARVEFKLRARQKLDVWIVNAHGVRVTTIVSGREYPKGLVALVFNGHGAGGALLPDGAYVPVVRLDGGHRTITLPNTIVLDTKAPTFRRYPQNVHLLLAPGTPGVAQAVLVPYTLNGPAHGLLFVDGHRVEITYRQRLSGVLQWDGTSDGRPVAAGAYSLAVAAQDDAGNRSTPLRVGQVEVRYLALARTAIRVGPRQRFSVRITLGPRRFSWLFAGRRGSSTARRLTLRAPRKRGRYRLYVSGAGHGVVAIVTVR
jgi:hypothetical protein